jgi:hypothetical protein
VTDVLRAVVSAKANADKRGSRKVVLLGEPARKYGQSMYSCQHQITIHVRHRGKALLPLFRPPAGPHRVGQPVLAWRLRPECLAANVSSTKCGESLKVQTGRRVSGDGVGRRSPISSCISSWRARCSSESDRRLISSSLIFSHRPVGGGFVMTSSTSAAYLFSRWEMT